MASSPERDPQHSVKELIRNLIAVIGKKDPYMKEHSERVAANCVRFARSLGMDPKDIHRIYLAALLHDIGIVYVPPEIARKPGELTEEELDIMQKHPLLSEKILSKYNIFNGILPLIRHHHEAVDGSGYPDGLKGQEIPFGARMIGLVNQYDIMTSNRPGRSSIGPEKALAKIKADSGKQFDRDLAERFIRFIQSSDLDKKEDTEQEGKDEVIERKTDQDGRNEAGTGEAFSVEQIIEDIIQQFKKGNINLPVLPKVVQDIQKVMNKPTTTVQDLASIIERDAVISVKLISVANSPLYRGTEKILTVKQAIPRLGLKETQSIVTAIANKSLYSVKDNYYKTAMEKLWLHSLAAGYNAKAIAEELSLGDPDYYFFMGLIHDIGKVLLLKTFSDIITRDASLDMQEVIDGIQAVHTSFGGAILRKWGFSETIVRISLLHQGPEFRPDTDEEILVANLAGKMATKIGYDLSDNKEIDLSRLASARILGIDPDQVETLCEETEIKMKETNKIF
jgi:HD-GYP domain-containing protein (c-di-GMP phosphodiesterase class II)